MKKIEHISQIITAITAITFISSLAHEFIFFLILGRQWQHFLNIADYFTIAITWFPAVTLFLVVEVLVIDFINPSKSSYPNKEAYKLKQKKRAIYFIITTLLMSLITYLIAPIQIFLCLLASIIGMNLLTIERFKRKRKHLIVPRKVKGLIYLSLTAVGMLGAFGGMDAMATVERNKSRFNITTSQDKIFQDVSIARSIQNGILIFNPNNNQVTFIMHEDLEQVEALNKTKISTPPACNFYNFRFCNIKNIKNNVVFSDSGI